ncbi:phasin family protein [Bradyrhizobium erythrophlei]|uniref:Phasin protein n=1 Tax=Bradyrhizobium erythrophlei TaxID=1437360 RepID=A0A1M5Y8U6_9BRAD|nr:Phasin protein [Bradyrhizobium erythrophlei]
MANQPASDIYPGKFPASVPFFDFAGLIEMSRNTLTETVKQNSKLSLTLQAIGKEWTEFVAARLHEDSQLLQTLRECRELPSMQRACGQFWEKAFSQYGEETQRLMQITQGAMEEATHVAQERIEGAARIAQERIEVTNSNARASGASSSTPPSSMKKVNPSHRDRA